MAIDPFALLPANSMRANIPMRDPKHAVAMASFVESIMDKAATAAAITPIATAIAMTLPLTSLAPLVAQIIAVMIAPSKVTARTPFANCLVSTRPSNTAIPARIPIATDTASTVPASFTVSPVPLSVVIFFRAFMNRRKAPANAIAFTISPILSCPASFATPTIISIDADTDNNNLPRPSIIFSLDFVIFTSNHTNPAKTAAKAAPLLISPGSSLETSFTTPTIRPIETTIDFTILPTESILSPARFDIAKYAITNPKNTPAKLRPFSTSSTDNILNSLIMPTISNMVLPILLIIFPALSIFLAASPFTSSPYMNKIPVIPSNKSPAHSIP